MTSRLSTSTRTFLIAWLSLGMFACEDTQSPSTSSTTGSGETSPSAITSGVEETQTTLDLGTQVGSEGFWGCVITKATEVGSDALVPGTDQRLEKVTQQLNGVVKVFASDRLQCAIVIDANVANNVGGLLFRHGEWDYPNRLSKIHVFVRFDSVSFYWKIRTSDEKRLNPNGETRLMCLQLLTWRNWQTRYLEVVVRATGWRFESSPGHFSEYSTDSRAARRQEPPAGGRCAP